MKPTDINVAGAIDLSSLRPPAGSGRPPQGAPRAPVGQAPSGAAPGGQAPSGAAVFDATEATFEDLVLRRSLQVPVLVDFWASWCGPCKQLSPVLERLAEEAGGAWVLAKVDVDANQALSGQLGIQSIPAVLLALGGRLIQGFTGALPERDVRAFLEQVLAAAAQAGVPGAGGAPAPVEGDEDAGPPPEPEVLVAEDALERGDFAAAVAAYDGLLARRPTDAMAQAGRASVLLFQRTDGVDADAVLRAAQAGPDDVAAQLAIADLEVLGDRVEEAAARLIALVRRTADDDRDAVRARLLELLAVLDPQDPRVVTARRSLANALF